MPASDGHTIPLVSAGTFASLRTAASSRSGWRAARSDAGEVAVTLRNIRMVAGACVPYPVHRPAELAGARAGTGLTGP